MFPRSSLHVAITTLSLHFLPEIPKAIRDKDSPAYNKGHIGVHGTRPEVAELFAEAQRKALRRFCECRAEEMAPGGVLAFFCTGREDRAHPEIQYSDDIIIFTWHFEKAWQELFNEGVIPSDLLDSYNVNACSPSTDDILEARRLPVPHPHFGVPPGLQPLPGPLGQPHVPGRGDVWSEPRGHDAGRHGVRDRGPLGERDGCCAVCAVES